MKIHNLPMRLSLLLATLLLCACARQASPPEANSQITAAPAAAEAPTMRAFIDPVTGELRDPTPEEQRALAAQEKAEREKAAQQPAPDARSRAPRETRQPDGSMEVVLSPDSQKPLTACVDKHGDVAVDHDCVSEKP